MTERGGSTPGSLVADPGSMSSSALHAARVLEASRARASNALLIGRRRSATGHPLAVMGPQLGYFYPELFMEVDAHGGGIDVRGGVLPGLPYVLIGRGPDYAWSATSANNDNTDQFLEELCNQDGTPATRSSDHYMYMGICRPMKDFFAARSGATVHRARAAGQLQGDGARAGERARSRSRASPTRSPTCAPRAGASRPPASSATRSTRGSTRSGTSAGRPRASASPSTCSTSTTGTSRSSPRAACRSGRPARTRACRRSARARTTGAASCGRAGIRRR